MATYAYAYGRVCVLLHTLIAMYVYYALPTRDRRFLDHERDSDMGGALIRAKIILGMSKFGPEKSIEGGRGCFSEKFGDRTFCVVLSPTKTSFSNTKLFPNPFNQAKCYSSEAPPSLNKNCSEPLPRLQSKTSFINHQQKCQ
jgi:hypothetical protein